MSDEPRHQALRTERELKETEEAFQKLRASFVERLFATDPSETDEREKLYLAVKVLDRVRGVMGEVVRSASDTDKIEEAAKMFRKS